MSKFSNESVMEHLRQAVSQITPDQAEELWKKPVVRADGSEWYLDGTASKRRRLRRRITAMSALAACFVLCVVSVFGLRLLPDATVYLDVNPSVELQINRFERVVSANAGNEDGEIVLKGMNLKHTDVNVALNAVIGSMARHGYLNEEKRTVLVSVACRNDKRAEKLKAELAGRIRQDIETLVSGGRVVSRRITPEDTVKDMAAQYKISQSKAALVRQVITEYPELDAGILANLSIGDLVDLLEDEDEDNDEPDLDAEPEETEDTDAQDEPDDKKNTDSGDEPDDEKDMDSDDDSNEAEAADIDDEPDDEKDVDSDDE